MSCTTSNLSLAVDPDTHHGPAGGDKGLESGALKIAKQTLRHKKRRAVCIGDFHLDTGAFWLFQ